MLDDDKIIHLPIKEFTTEWYQYRSTGVWIEVAGQQQFFSGGIGASEVGVVMGTQEYESRAQLWARKVGFYQKDFIDNERTLSGKLLENKVLDFWRCWDGVNYVHHMSQWMNGVAEPPRTFEIYKHFVLNIDYPWLFVTLDAFAPPGSVRMDTGEVVPTGFPVDAKCMGLYRFRTFQNERADGMDPAYNDQLHTQALACRTQYAELAVLADNALFKCHSVDISVERQQEIVELTHEFWWGRVIPARKHWREAVMLQAKGDQLGYEDQFAHVLSYEPDPQPIEGYIKYKREQYQRKAEVSYGTTEHEDVALEYKALTQVISKINKRRDHLKAHMAKWLVDTGADEIKFPHGGRLYYDARKTMQVRPKGDVEQIVKSKIERLGITTENPDRPADD